MAAVVATFFIVKRPDLSHIEKLIESLLANEAMELVDMRYLQAGGRWILRCYVDKRGGITLDDCERLSDNIGAVLDADDAMTRSYTLEVSSPGVDRVLKKAKDFERFSGHPVKIRLKAPLAGRRCFTGCLHGYQDGKVILESGSSAVRLELAAIEEARLDPEIKI